VGRAVFIVAALGFAACSAPPEMPGQTEAVELVWKQAYGCTDQAPQLTWWMTSCPAAAGGVHPGKPTAVYLDGKCYDGLSYVWGSDVAWRGSFSKSAFAHELMHDAQGREGITDPDHQRAADWAKVTVANSMLDAAGL